MRPPPPMSWDATIWPKAPKAEVCRAARRWLQRDAEREIQEEEVNCVLADTSPEAMERDWHELIGDRVK